MSPQAEAVRSTFHLDPLERGSRASFCLVLPRVLFASNRVARRDARLP